MNKYMMVITALILAACAPLPDQIADRCAQLTESCYPAAKMLYDVMRVLQFRDVKICTGIVYSQMHGEVPHAWCLYTTDDGEVRIVDPYALLGQVSLSWELYGDLYVEQVTVSHMP